MNTILVVDDRPDARYALVRILEGAGYDVRETASGRDALRLARMIPDLIVLDIALQDMDGFEVCRTLRSEGNEVPVIFLTARDTTSDTIRGLTLGGDDYVTKPSASRS